jgi:hypothetical protein
LAATVASEFLALAIGAVALTRLLALLGGGDTWASRTERAAG